MEVDKICLGYELEGRQRYIHNIQIIYLGYMPKRDLTQLKDGFPCPHRKGIHRSRGIAPIILKLGTRYKWMFNFTPRLLCLRKRTPAPIEYGDLACPRAGLDVLEKRKISCLYHPILNYATRSRGKMYRYFSLE